MKKGRAGTMTHDYKRNGTTTLFAALNGLDLHLSAIENQQDILPGKLSRHTSRNTWKQAVFDVGMIR
jgi:hypothetical protein